MEIGSAATRAAVLQGEVSEHYLESRCLAAWQPSTRNKGFALELASIIACLCFQVGLLITMLSAKPDYRVWTIDHNA